MPTYYKDFSGLNQALSQPKLSKRSQLINRLINDIDEAKQIPMSLADEWARSYAAVMVLKYDENGNPSDVTPTVTGNGLDVPNSIISRVSSKFEARRESIITDLNEIGDEVISTTTMDLGTLPSRPTGQNRWFDIHFNETGIVHNNLRIAHDFSNSSMKIGFSLYYDEYTPSGIWNMNILKSDSTAWPVFNCQITGYVKIPFPGFPSASPAFFSLKFYYDPDGHDGAQQPKVGSVEFKIINLNTNAVYTVSSNTETVITSGGQGVYFTLTPVRDSYVASISNKTSGISTVTTITPEDIIGEDGQIIEDIHDELVSLLS